MAITEKAIPQKVSEMIGKSYDFGGQVFSGKSIPLTALTILDAKWCDAKTSYHSGGYSFTLSLDALDKLLEFMQRKGFDFLSLVLEGGNSKELNLINEIFSKYGFDID